MIEIVVWLLLSAGTNGAAHTVSQHKTQEVCEEARKKIWQPYSSRCISAKIYVVGVDK